ncbi:MAG: MBL fold metallo-hydrolase [Pseudomonadota bacterium]
MPATPEYMNYPLDGVPEPGSTLTVADGVQWLRMPLPFMLGHINLWLLDDHDSQLALIDSGLNSDETQAHWRSLLLGKQVSRVIVTHMHPDHVGSAGWLCDEYDAPLSMSMAEYLMCRVLVADTGQPAPAAGVAFYRAAGFSGDALQKYQDRFGMFGKAVSTLPNAYHRLKHDDVLTIGASDWRVVTTSGHCPEHASLYNERDNLFIAGDQLLPTISSNVSVWPTEPEGDPLGFWLDSCRRLQRILDPEVLVLPSHGKPFTGAHGRLQALVDEHEDGLEKLRILCKTPQRAVDVFPALFKSKINDGNLIMATGEALAHLNYLKHREDIVRTIDDDGVHWYATR